MKVPFRLRRVAESRPVTALLLPGHEVSVLLQVCARWRLDPPPRVYAVADGFLLRLDKPPRQPLAGVVRLGEAGTNLLMPVDGELVPALLQDEAAALGRKRGLIFLPQGRVLEFDPDQPLSWADFLGPGCRLTSAWRSLPAASALAETLNEIELDQPAQDADELLQAGGEGIGTEQPRPDGASLPKKLLGGAALGAGRGLFWLGNFLHARALARAGARAMEFGLNLFPRLSEKLLGRQEAGLRELLREFRAGNVEQALRRALPLNKEVRGTQIYQGTHLPRHDIRYSLGNILGGRGGGSIWFTELDLFQELDREYRKQAEAAAGRGDFRRAAFIYGKLLNDYAMAAAVLSQGGLHHDAALLYLQALGDYRAAARQFELAGDMDRALQLYRQEADHVGAGDLLRRLGEEELAVAEYRQAADRLVQAGQGHHQAGQLMLHKAQRPDLAREYFEAGWALRPASSALPCARSLAGLHADAGETTSLMRLVTQAEEFFHPPGNEAASGEFFNHIARLAPRPALSAIREQLYDRALMNLAHKLRQNAGDAYLSPLLLSQMFAAGETWKGNLVNDAGHALHATRLPARPQAAAPVPVTQMAIPATIPVIRSVFQAAAGEEIFLGFESGEVVCFNPGVSSVELVEDQPGPVRSMVASTDGAWLVVLSAPEGKCRLACYKRGDSWRQVMSRQQDASSASWLVACLTDWSKRNVGIWDEQCASLRWASLPNLIPQGDFGHVGVPNVALLFPFYHQGGGRDQALLTFDGRCMWYLPDTFHCQCTVPCSFPQPQAGSSLALPPVHCLPLLDSSFELVGLGEGGSLSWLKIHLQGSRLENHTLKSVPGPFQAAAMLSAGRIVAVDARGVVYLQASETGIKEQSRQPCSLPDTIACYVCHRSRELLAVSSNGTVSRLACRSPRPGRVCR